MIDPAKDPYYIASLARGLEVLRCFRDGGPLSSGEITKATGLPPSTVWRICYTLVACGFLEKDGEAQWRLRDGVKLPGDI